MQLFQIALISSMPVLPVQRLEAECSVEEVEAEIRQGDLAEACPSS